ncbi:MAG TPA: D-alanine--D-alanine ligase, partial [bacterium]|nr:D-alanine--D-alanine ligase [bacterium]
MVLERECQPGRVGVLLGGPSSEREISIKSGKAVSRALRSRGVEVVEIGIEEEVREGLAREALDAAFVVLHGRFGEDGQVQALLEKMGVPYTGSGVEASRLALDKAASRAVFRGCGLPVPETVLVRNGSAPARLPFPFPVVVKPSREGSSIGLGMARDREELEAACRTASAYDRTVLVEPLIAGKEITVGILGDRALPAVEIIPSHPFFDFEAKYTPGVSEFLVPARLETSVAERAARVALSAHAALGCYAYSRVDMLVRPGGDPVLLEVNTIPGFTENSLYPRACAAVGISFEELCLEL